MHVIIFIMQNKQLDFSDKLIKGRIAEIVFEQMLRDAGHFTVLRFGYEYVLPEITHALKYEKSETLQTLRTAPDFAVINKKTKEVRLIEVKFQRVLQKKYVLEDAERMAVSWNPSYLFIATLDGFFFDEISEIVSNQGVIKKFKFEHVPESLQIEYLDLLRKYEFKSTD